MDLKNRGVGDVFFLVCDGLKGLPDVVGNVWPQCIVQTCVIHLIRNTFRLTSRADTDAIKRGIKSIYTAPNADAALIALDELEEQWGKKYRAMIRLWRNAWAEFVPFLAFGACRRIGRVDGCTVIDRRVVDGRCVDGVRLSPVGRRGSGGNSKFVDFHEVECCGGQV